MTDSFDDFVAKALGLFPTPDVPEPVAPNGIYGALATTWTQWKGLRRPCSACVELVHERGTDKAPAVQAATWRRKGPNGDRFLCGPHAEQHRRLDKQVADKHAADAVLREHADKAKRAR